MVTVPSGLLVVHKPVGPSSAHVVAQIKRVLQEGAVSRSGCFSLAHRRAFFERWIPSEEKHSHLQGGQQSKSRHGNNGHYRGGGIVVRKADKINIKVGHGGTLDPLADGVLVLGIGNGTKLLQKYLTGPKGYSATAVLGTATTTLDCTGEVTASTDTITLSQITYKQVLDVLPSFSGDIMQVPPMFSALSIGGQRLYKLAREGKEVHREPRPVSIQSLHLHLDANQDVDGAISTNADASPDPPEQSANPSFTLAVQCSGGTYIRTLIADIGAALGTHAHMSQLTRTNTGVGVGVGAGACTDFGGLVDTLDLTLALREEEWAFDNLVQHIHVCNAAVGLKANELQPALELPKIRTTACTSNSDVNSSDAKC